MKEQALKIVSDLINTNKINGEDAVILIQAIMKTESCQFIPDYHRVTPNDVKIVPYTNTTGVDKTPMISSITATTEKQVEVIYDSQATTNKKEELIYG